MGRGFCHRRAPDGLAAYLRLVRSADIQSALVEDWNALDASEVVDAGRSVGDTLVLHVSKIYHGSTGGDVAHCLVCLAIGEGRQKRDSSVSSSVESHIS